MSLDSRGREVVSYVRVGRGMVKVTKYENEQPKSPSDIMSVTSRSSSGRSASRPGPPTRGWLGRPRAKGSSKRTPSTQRHRSRSRSSTKSLHTIRRPSGYMRPDHNVPSSEHHPGDATTPGRRERLGPQGRLPVDILPVPGSLRPGELPYDKESNYPKSTPCSSIERGRGHGLHISPPLGNQAAPHPSPSTLSWTTESETGPTADAEMWAHITRLEDELVSRFGRGAVPQFSSLRNEKSSAPPTTGGKQDLTPALPDDLLAVLQRDPSSSQRLKQRSFEPIYLAEPPRRVHRAKSSPTLVFPLPPPTIPSWVTHTPLPSPPGELPRGFAPSYVTMRARAGPPPPFGPPPDFPPPPPPVRPGNTRPKVPDTTEDAEAIAALYRVLLQRTANTRSGIGNIGHGTLQPEEAGRRKDPGFNEPRSSRTRPFGILKEDLPKEDKGGRTPSAKITGTV
ncbi:unnamed protein product [Rhizoctonia solani]|uniref:Uncharacterized protein n=1 Tax=Rhizoctonia solani TaxID=456999 RepID=A0A8H3HN04_9AGAM|nr:unnamed protein product [Rhizoctonia solani]